MSTQTPTVEVSPVKKARHVQKRLREQGIFGVPETMLLAGLFDLYAKVETLERQLAAQPPQGRAKRNAGD